MLKTLVVGAAAALLMTSNAVADGMPRRAAKASPVCCEPNWTGFYIGVGIGGAFTHARAFGQVHRGAKRVRRHTGSNVFRLWDLDSGRSHAFGTVTVGYDHQFSGHWVAGLFVDYDFGNGKNESRILEMATSGIPPALTRTNTHGRSVADSVFCLARARSYTSPQAGLESRSTATSLFWYGELYRRRSFDNDAYRLVHRRGHGNSVGVAAQWLDVAR